MLENEERLVESKERLTNESTCNMTVEALLNNIHGLKIKETQNKGNFPETILRENIISGRFQKLLEAK